MLELGTLLSEDKHKYIAADQRDNVRHCMVSSLCPDSLLGQKNNSMSSTSWHEVDRKLGLFTYHIP